MRAALLFLFVAQAEAHGAGVWKDPGHYASDVSLAGTRYVAEYPPHVLTMVGTDDGANWWKLVGYCSGEGMTEIHFDFSPKGGPADLMGTWSVGADGVESITWPDGNSWTGMPTPTPAYSATLTNTFHGLFVDPLHEISGSFGGMRFIAEQPQHTLSMIGSDDGKTWWFLQGICHDENKTPMFRFDFSPKGGPKEVVARWNGLGLEFEADGNVWTKL